MPRVIVNKSLSDTLRSIRLQNKIQSKQLAEKINKSPAYVSRLEKGEIKTMEMGELSSILHFITGEKSSEELIETIYHSLNLKYTAKEIEEELWFYNYETVTCSLPLPKELIEYMNQLIYELGISRQDLLARINSNESLSKEEKSDKSFPDNQWYLEDINSPNKRTIKIHMSEVFLSEILDNKRELSPYIYILCIVFYLLKIKKFGSTVLITPEQNNELMDETKSTLHAYKFLTVSEKNRIISEKQTQKEILEVLNSFDKDNIDIINDIVQSFRFITEQNIKNANEVLNAFSQNMHWDIGFMIKIISIDYKSLKKTSFSNKKRLVEDIEELVEKYKNLPDEQNRIELY